MGVPFFHDRLLTNPSCTGLEQVITAAVIQEYNSHVMPGKWHSITLHPNPRYYFLLAPSSTSEAMISMSLLWLSIQWSLNLITPTTYGHLVFTVYMALW